MFRAVTESTEAIRGSTIRSIAEVPLTATEERLTSSAVLQEAIRFQIVKALLQRILEIVVAEATLAAIAQVLEITEAGLPIIKVTAEEFLTTVETRAHGTTIAAAFLITVPAQAVGQAQTKSAIVISLIVRGAATEVSVADRAALTEAAHVQAATADDRA
jgi:hypothetical protein